VQQNLTTSGIARRSGSAHTRLYSPADENDFSGLEETVLRLVVDLYRMLYKAGAQRLPCLSLSMVAFTLDTPRAAVSMDSRLDTHPCQRMLLVLGSLQRAYADDRRHGACAGT